MRRFRLRRRRLAAAALAPIAAIFTTTAFAEQAAPTGESARIDASSRSVPFGERVSLRGAFPGAGRAPIQILHRATEARPGAPSSARTPTPTGATPYA